MTDLIKSIFKTLFLTALFLFLLTVADFVLAAPSNTPTSDVGQIPTPKPRQDKPGRQSVVRTVYVIDTGLDLNDPRYASHLCPNAQHLDFTKTGLKDTVGHGTAIVGLITKTKATNYCLVIYKYYDPAVRDSVNSTRLGLAIMEAARHNPAFVNISSSGTSKSGDEAVAIAKARNTTFVIAAGNNGSNEYFYPAGYQFKNVVAVGSMTREWVIAESSNHGSWIKEYEVGEDVEVDKIGGGTARGSGTSYACAVHTARLLNESKN